MYLDSEYNHLAIYLRISPEKKNENEETLKNHREILIDYAKSLNCTYDIFGEVISGGKSDLEERKELQRLLNSIEKYDAILCFELSRLSRNGLISQTVKQYCMDYDKSILTPYHEYDLANNENDRLMYDLGSLISSHEHGVIGKRSKMNKIQMSKAGLHVSGNVPFGFRRNYKTKRLEIKDDEARVVRYIFDLHLKGLGSYKIRDILNKEGYKSAKNNYFELPTIKRIIKNPVYKGTIVFNDRKRKKKNGRFIYEVVDKIVVEKAHPWIIPPEKWEMANNEQEEREKKAALVREKPAVKTGITMLKDLIYCGVCNRKMAFQKDNKNSVGYTIKRCEYLLDNGNKCRNCGIKLEFVEQEVHEEIQSYKEKLNEALEKLQLNNVSNIKEQLELKLSMIEKQLEDIQLQHDRLIDLAIQGIFTPEKIREKKQEILITEQHLYIEKNKIIGDLVKPSLENVSEKLTGIIDTIENLKTMNTEELNETLKIFINKIYYTRIIPIDLLKKSTRNKERKYYPFQIEIEYKQ